MPGKTPIPKSWEVPQVFRDRLGEEAGRQRAMFADGHLLLILHEAPRSADDERTGRFFWRKPDGEWKSNALGAGIRALRRHLKEYREAVHKLDEFEEEAESAADYFKVVREVAPLLRSSRHMHQALQQAREMVHDSGVISCRDEAGAIERSAELLDGDARNGLDFAMARTAESQARIGYEIALAGHKLNLLAATFFPIATVATVFGMNLTHGLENREPVIFWGTLTVGVAIGLIVRSMVRRPQDPSRRRPPRQDSRR